MPTPDRFIRYVVLATLAAAILLPAPAAAGDRCVVATSRLRAAEARLLKDINRIRVRNGRKRLRLDKRTSQVARARSSDMAAKRYFAHVEPDGDDARHILQRRGISATEVTENIGHTVGLTLKRGSRRMADWWYHSPPHRTQMLAGDINYVGIGVARRGNRYTYTAIFTRSRDKTRPRVIVEDTSWVSNEGASEVTIEWRGVDPELATGTAGIKRFDVEYFTPVGWDRLEGNPRQSRRSIPTDTIGDQHIRVRAVDKAGNVGPWAYTRVDIPDRSPRLV